MTQEYIEVNGVAMADNRLSLECNKCGPLTVIEAEEGQNVNELAREEGHRHMNSHNVPDENINVTER